MCVRLILFSPTEEITTSMKGQVGSGRAAERLSVTVLQVKISAAVATNMDGNLVAKQVVSISQSHNSS